MSSEDLFSEVTSVLESLRGSNPIFVPNPGNAGDSFIAHATYQFFDRIGLDYEVGDERAAYSGRNVIYGSGGNMVSHYINLNNFLLRNASICDRVVVLPHTIRAYRNTLAGLGENCTIFCRDAVTHEFVARNARKARVLLQHDMALAADFNETNRLADAFPIPLLSNRYFARRNIKRLAITFAYKAQSSKTLNAFRLDAERTERPIPQRNIDVSAVFATGNMSRTDALETTFRMMRFIEGFETISTNRLHVAIVGAILGKNISFYDNSYGKNSAVFQHSIAERYPNVQWRDEEDVFRNYQPDIETKIA